MSLTWSAVGHLHFSDSETFLLGSCWTRGSRQDDYGISSKKGLFLAQALGFRRSDQVDQGLASLNAMAARNLRRARCISLALLLAVMGGLALQTFVACGGWG